MSESSFTALLSQFLKATKNVLSSSGKGQFFKPKFFENLFFLFESFELKRPKWLKSLSNTVPRAQNDQRNFCSFCTSRILCGNVLVQWVKWWNERIQSRAGRIKKLSSELLRGKSQVLLSSKILIGNVLFEPRLIGLCNFFSGFIHSSSKSIPQFHERDS